MTLDKKIIENMRREYRSASLTEAHIAPDPISQFAKWFAEALDTDLYEPNAMTLATAQADGTPSARVVLLKGFEEKGFIFYTNYLSRKARELELNPLAALVLYWGELGRQVRIEGITEKISLNDSERYFHSRPRNS